MKVMRKIVLLIICFVIIMTAITSCSGRKAPPEDRSDPEQSSGSGMAADTPVTGVAADTPDDTPVTGVYNIALASFPPDTVMIRTKDHDDVTWAELFVYMRSRVGSLSEYFDGDPIDWSAPWDDKISCAEWVLQYAKADALVMKAIEYGARLHGITLSEEDWALIREENYNSAMDWGGEEEYLKMLWKEKGFTSLELFEYVKSFSRLSELLLKRIFGNELELLPEEEVAEFVADDGFIMAKHIFLFKPEYGGAEDAFERAEDILAKLNAYSGEDFDSYFDELTNTYSDDTERLDIFPHGFLFQYGDLTQCFFESAESLEINGLSGIVEDDDGYHIIYRIPINYDVVPVSYYFKEDYRTLRMLVAYAEFGLLLNDWESVLNPEFTDELESIDVSVMFKDA